jgi:hypothetical protein
MNLLHNFLESNGIWFYKIKDLVFYIYCVILFR